MLPIVTTTEVDQPANGVLTYATDPTRFHEWQQSVIGGRTAADGGDAASHHPPHWQNRTA